MGKLPRWMQLGLVAALLGVLAVGVSFYRNQAAAHRRHAEEELTAIAELKVAQIVNWRKERLGDAAVLQGSLYFGEGAARYISQRNAEDAAFIFQRFESLHAIHGYADILLVDTQGAIVLQMSDPPEPYDGYLPTLGSALEQRRPLFLDLHAHNAQHKPHLSIIAPLYEYARAGAEAVGAVILISSADDFLYPLIQSWPVPSDTAETLLVRREGDSALFLNELRHRQGTALQLSIPLTQTQVPAVQAVLGRQGVFLGDDYRGVPVVSVVLPVPDSPWYIVAKQDVHEVYAAWRAQAALMLGMLGTLLGLVAMLGWVAWQRNERDSYLRLYQAEATLRASVERQAITLRSIGDAVIATDAQGRVELLNPVAETLTGWSETEAIGQPIGVIFPIVNEMTRTEVENPVERVLREGMVVGLANHTVLRARTGAEHPIADSGAPIRDEAGAITGVVLVFSDQSAERAAERAIHESEARYRSLFENQHTVMFVIDPDGGRIVDANPAAVAYYGWSREQLQSMTASDLNTLPPDEVQERMDLAKSRQQNHFSFQHRRADGSVRDVEVYSGPITQQGCQLLFSIVHDVTERKRAEAQAQRWLRMFQVAEFGLAHVNALDNTFIEVNAAFARERGYTPEELHGQPIYTLNTPKALAQAQERVREIDLTGNLTFESEHRRKDGTTFPVLQQITTITDAEGRPISRVVYALDITEQKRAADALRQNEERLASLVRVLQHRAPTTQAFLDYALEEALRLTNSQYGYIYFYDEETRLFTLNTWSRDVLAACTVANPASMYELDKTSVWGEAVRQRKPIMLNDFQAPHPHKRGYPEGHAPLHRFLTVPVMDGERIVAVVGVANKANVYDDTDVLHLTLLMDAVWKVVEQRRAEEALRRIEWMLSPAATSEAVAEAETYTQGYGDLVALNTERTILDAVGEETLRDLASEFLGLLGTSTAIYERNGDYALGIFSSGWCRLMDQASRVLSDTDDNAAALAGGQWLCHESCWCEAARQAIATGEITDVECSGGLRLFAVPIKAGGQVVGAISTGYGQPPTDEARLLELAGQYRVPVAELAAQAAAYEVRPPYIIAMAKRQMEASARVIGEIVERRWMQDVLRQNQEQLRSLIQYAPVAIAMFDRDMRYIVASGRWAADYEREMDDLVGRSHYDVFTDLPEAWRGVHQRAMAGEYITNDDDLWVHADGTLQWLRWVVLPWRDAQGEMGGIIISSEDITERRQLELERRKFFLLAESSSEFIGMCDLDMQPLYVNPAGRRMVGLPDMAAACSVKVQDYYFPEDQKFIAEEFFPRVLREGHGDVEIRLRHFQTGEPIWMFYYLYSVHDFSGNAIGWATVSRDITERRQAEAALRESEERFRTIMASMRDIVFTLDRDQRHTGVYGPWVEQIGMTPEQFLGKNAVEILGPEAGQAHVEANERALQGEFVVYNWSVPTPEGVRYYQTSLSPITDESGQVQGLVGVGRDLTDIRRAEEERAKSHELLTRLAEQVPGVVYQYQLFPDGRSRFPYASPGIWDIYEVTPEEVREDATPVFGRLHPEDYDRISAEIFESARTQELFHSEFRVLLPSQGVRWRLCDAKPTLLEDGSTLWHGIISDITERKRVEAELAESEARYRQLVSSSPYAVVVHQDEHVVYVNPAAVRLYGAASSDEILGRHVSDFMTPEGLEEAHARFRRLLAGETGVYPAETCYQRLDGSQVIAEVTAAPFSYNGRPAVQFLALNVTERRKAEQERDRLQEQLNQAQKMESVGRLAGGVAHDFNNMLSVIIGNTDLAMDEVDPHAPLYADLSEIRKAAERSANLTRQLLAFARKQTIAPRVLDLNETVTSMLRMLQRLIGEDIDLVWKPGRALWPIKMDPAQVDQILANLAVNARDAIAGVGNLTIETENVTFDEDYCAAHAEITPGDYVMLAVSDTGCGMDKATQQHLFEPFFTTKDVGKGTGLGLATIYGIVRQNNGLVNVYSEPGEGTTFRIYLPRVAEADVREAAVSAGRPAGGTETVLIVEDELAILKLGEAVLRRLGYTALAARTPAEALALAAEHDGPIHLLITDVVMPEMNGRDLQLRVKALRPDIKMLYMSGYTANVIAHHGVLDEGVRFMQKPFSVRSLGALVREVLDS